MEDLPLTPEDWRAVVQNAAVTTGHADEVIVAVESTMSGWKVTVNPVINGQQPATPTGPPSS